MKAYFRPQRPKTRQQKQIRERIKMDIDRYLDAKKQTMGDRICAMMLITLNGEFGFGPARLSRFWRAFQQDVKQHLQDWEDTDDGLLFARLEHIGMERMIDVIQDDYAAEREAVRGSMFDLEEDDDDTAVSEPGTPA